MSTHELESIAPPRPGLVSVDGRKYPLVSVRVSARAEGGIAATTLTQVFANPHAEALEVVYTMPLPADGAVLGYTIRMGEKVIRAEVQPREDAEEAYREALYQGRTAGLLEQDRADTFQQRLGNLPPQTKVEVEIEILQPLAFMIGIDASAPQWEYRFPTVVGVRYEGAPGRVPDAGRLDVNRDDEGGIPTRAELAVTIADRADSGLGIVSPSHDIVQEQGPEDARVCFRAGERLDRDIVLRWNACAGEIGVRAVEGRGLEGDEGRYALLTVVPPAVATAVFHRDLTVLIDASGSMSGMPLVLARQVVTTLVHSLEPGDRFELLAFAEKVVPLTRGVVEATDSHIRQALDALAVLQAGGGTEMLNAVDQALVPLRKDSQRQVVLVTDGYIGFEAEVIGRIARALPAASRVHAVGIGAAPNRALIQGIAAAGRGVEQNANDEATAVEAARRLCAGTARPVLTNLALTGSAVGGLAPERPRDVFAGQPDVLTVELAPEGGVLELSGQLAGASEAWVRRIEVPASGVAAGLATTPVPIGALHGRLAIADLEIKLAAQDGEAEAETEIEARGMRHRIASRRTSLVAIAEEPSVDPKAPRRRERLPVELPAGVSAEGMGLQGGQMICGSAHGAIAELRRAGARSHLGHSLKPSFTFSREARTADALNLAHDRRGPEPLQIEAVNVWRLGGEILVIEFETPCDGFMLLEERDKILVDPLFLGVAHMLVDQSSPRGPHGKGLIVRLAMRIESGRVWPADGRVQVGWRGRRVLPSGKMEPVMLSIRLDVPHEIKPPAVQ